MSTLHALLAPFIHAQHPRPTALDAANNHDRGIYGDHSGPITRAFDYTVKDLSLRTVAAVQQWEETYDLDAGESLADRLRSLLFGIADMNGDGAIEEDEYIVLDFVLNAAHAYLLESRAEETDINALLESWDAKAALRVMDAVTSAFEAGLAGVNMDTFTFSGDGHAMALDSVLHTLGRAIVRGAKALRWRRPKQYGHVRVRMSSAQKLALRKAQQKSHSAEAQAKRLRTLGLKGNPQHLKVHVVGNPSLKVKKIRAKRAHAGKPDRGGQIIEKAARDIARGKRW